MTQKVLTFFGERRDQNGMPAPFYRYLILESEAPWLGPSIRIASIVPLTDPAPMPVQRQFLSGQGSNQAMDLAANALKEHLKPQLLKTHET